MIETLIFKPKESLIRSLSAAFRDICVTGGENNTYQLRLHSILVPGSAVLGRFSKNEQGAYVFEPEFYRFSENAEELKKVEQKIERGEVELVRKLLMSAGDIDSLLERFHKYAESIDNRELALKNWRAEREFMKEVTGTRLSYLIGFADEEREREARKYSITSIRGHGL